MKYKIIENCNRYKFISHKKTIENVRFFNSNVTYISFRKYKLSNVDFMGCNLKHSNFKNAIFKNVMFYNVNLSKSNFLNSKFINCHFINCKFDKVRNFKSESLNIYNSNFNNVFVSEKLEKEILKLNRVPRFKTAYVFTTKSSKGKKLNKGVLSLFLNDFTEHEFLRVVKAISKRNNRFIKNQLTYGQFYEFSNKYLKK